MSQLEVDKIIPQSGTTLTLGDTGDTINFGSGVLPNFENLTVTGDFTVDTNSLKVDSTNNRVGIGTSSPTQALDVVGNLTASGTGTFVNESRVQQFASQSDLIIQRAQGSSGSPTAVANGQTLGVLSFKGYTSAGVYRTGSSLTARVTQGVSGDELPTSLYFSTTANGANSPTERMRITDAGLIGIGTSSPSTVLDVRDETNGANFIVGGSGTTNITKIGGGAGDSLQLFTNSTTPVMLLSTSGNVGIGTTSPDNILMVSSDGASASAQPLSIVNPARYGTNDSVELEFGMGRANDTNNLNFPIIGLQKEQQWQGASTSVDASVIFKSVSNQTASEKMRIDSSGNLLLDKTTTSNTTAGVRLGVGGVVAPSRTSDAPIVASRLSTDGRIIELRQDSTLVGSIGVQSGDRLYVAAGSGLDGIGIDGHLFPTDNTGVLNDDNMNLGLSNSRWKDLYLSGGAYLGGTGSANYLDDYEEGTWTPTDASGAGLTFASSSGQYVKIGKMVYLGGNINYPGNGDSSTMLIGGLPFTCANIGSADQYGVAVVSTNVGANHLFRIQKNTTNILPRTNTNTVIANSVYSSKFFQFFGQYQTT